MNLFEIEGAYKKGDKMDIEKIRRIANLDIRIQENQIKLDELYKKTDIYKQIIKKDKNPENVEFLLSIILHTNGCRKKASIYYITLLEYMSVSIVNKRQEFICTVYGETLLEVLKKSFIIMHILNKGENT